MRSSLVISLIGAASMAAALLVGCGDNDAKPVASQIGQSCVRTADCADGLSCIANVCYKTAPPATGGQGGGAAVTPVPPSLGGEGESCNSRRDCVADLGCFNNRCTSTAPMGEAGASSGTGIVLGSRGETCRVNGDCGKDLVCVPSTVSGTGVCDLSSYGLEPTGLTCSGECLADSDCYQLPTELHTTTIKSCEDIDAAITTNTFDCTAPATPEAKTLCFEQATYCGYVAKKSKTWTCDTDTNHCVYNTACVVASGMDAPTGCPSYSRTRSLAALTCNPDSKKCVGAAVAASCTTDAKCEGKQVYDSTVATDVCSAGECTCYTGNKQCYRKCARDIDCGAGLACDGKLKLCVPSASCNSDAECAASHHNLAFVCKEGACAHACKADRDCSPSGLVGGAEFNGQVCGVDGFCASVAANCTADAQCGTLAPGGLKLFCVTPPAAAGSPVASGITD